ncbi:hypothetical protein AVEN_184922-1, partial [Araneus ventricosus]
HIEWRKEWKIDTILTDYKPLEVCKYTPTSFVGFDKEGSLVRYFDMGNPDNKGMFNSIKKTEFLKYCFYVGEQDAERSRQHSLKDRITVLILRALFFVFIILILMFIRKTALRCFLKKLWCFANAKYLTRSLSSPDHK